MAFNIKSTDRITLSGLPGQGKTVMARYLAKLAMPRVKIWDPLSQYTRFPPENRYLPVTDSTDELEEQATLMCSEKNMVWVIEEAEKYLRQGAQLTPNLFSAINRGRNWGLGIVAVTRRIQVLDKNFFDLCQHVFFFRCGLRSRSYIEDMVGKESMKKISELKPFHFLHFDLQTEESTVATLDLGPGQSALTDDEPVAPPESEPEGPTVVETG